MPTYAFLFLALALLAPAAQAYDPKDLHEAMSTLQDQLQKIDKLGNASCPEEHAKFNDLKELRFSLFYGYENYDDITADAMHAAAMAKQLQKKCSGNIAACGFRLTARAPNKVKLERTVDGRPVVITIQSTSVSEDDAANSNFGHNQWKQYAQSALIWRDFHRSFKNSDVVFYSGHSRVGSGLGFNIESWPQQAYNMVFKQPLKATVEALRERPNRIKLMGLFACDADKYYRSAFHQANPNMDMILSREELGDEAGEQAAIGSINALLTKKCSRDLNKSLRSVSTDAPGKLEYVRTGKVIQVLRTSSADSAVVASDEKSAQ